MQALLDAAAEMVGLLPPSRVQRMASALRGLANVAAAPSASALADTPAARESIGRVLAAWAQAGVSGDEVAGVLLGASAERSRMEREVNVELVWTGPTTRFVPTRRTEQVLLDLIASARRDLFLVSFVAYDVDSVVAALKDASSRGVRMRVLLEASSDHGGTLSYDPAAKLRVAVPRVEVFTWKVRAEPFAGGKVHAKVAVVDAARAFVTSANLTGHALEKNMEAGVLVKGGPLPRSLSDHLQSLIDVGIIEPA